MAGNPIPKLDSENNIIGETTITEARANGWPRRVTRIFISNEKGEYLLQKRSMEARIHPCVWDCSGGHVDVGESYAEAGVREVFEELQVHVSVTEVREPIFFADTFYVACRAVIDSKTSFILKEDEVVDTKWVSKTELLQLLKLHPDNFTPWVVHAWENLEKELTDAL
tara:strand:- start:2091 stop:2594 length:504 start_codon:yes stop_codon:yes gene_type:complete